MHAFLRICECVRTCVRVYVSVCFMCIIKRISQTFEFKCYTLSSPQINNGPYILNKQKGNIKRLGSVWLVGKLYN